MKPLWVFCGLVALLVGVGYWHYRQYPVPNARALHMRVHCINFFARRPALKRTAAFLKSQGISYDKLTNAEIFDGNQATDFQRQHRKEIASALVFRIYNIKQPFCGSIDALFIVNFDKRGQLLKAENLDMEYGCLDF